MLEKEGRHLGLPTLRAEFPDVPRCELGELQAAYRRHFQATHRRTVARLAWHGPGCVWATDHVAPPGPIDGVDRAALAVRDLASGVELAWQPVPDQTAVAAAAAMKPLLDQFGPPLVLKSDNGSAFISEDFGQMLTDREVAWLPSPPRKPWYNGGCEAGNGSMRTRTDHFAEPAGGNWTRESMEAARHQANELTRPQGHRGPTPSNLWSTRVPIGPQQRKQFLAAVERHRAEIIAERKSNLNLKNKNHQRQVQRQAVRRALLECGLLTITWRSVSPPLNPKKRDKIS
jgi:transposase InsO family protein